MADHQMEKQERDTGRASPKVHFRVVTVSFSPTPKERNIPQADSDHQMEKQERDTGRVSPRAPVRVADADFSPTRGERDIPEADRDHQMEKRERDTELASPGAHIQVAATNFSLTPGERDIPKAERDHQMEKPERDTGRVSPHLRVATAGFSPIPGERDIPEAARLSPELNLINCLNKGTSQVPSDQNTKVEATPKVFSCNYCQRKFYSSQALGGHQNAHKRERILTKKGQRLGQHFMAAAAAFGRSSLGIHHHHHHHRHHYSSIASLPLHGTLHKPLGGIQAHSMMMIKPSYTQTSSGNIKRPFISQQPAVGENFYNSPSAGLFLNEKINRSRTMISPPPGQVLSEGLWTGSSSNHLETNRENLDLSLRL